MSPGLQPFGGSYEEFDWDEPKRLKTLTERHIDFVDVARFFFGPMWDTEAGIELLSVVYTERKNGSQCRIISVRAADPREREEYNAAIQEG
jgi:uncharacterized DUF497 family protein